MNMAAHEDAFRRLSAAREAEEERVSSMIKRDQTDRKREDDRHRAELQIREGLYVNLGDSVVEPTPEWLEKGDIASFTPKQPDGTVRTIKTVRRVRTPITFRMHVAGKLNDDQLAACDWYRETFEAAGLEGRWSSSRYDSTGGGGGTGLNGPMALHEFEAISREAYRAARNSITAFYLKFFEKIVLDDLPLRRAARFAKCRDDRAQKRFRDCANELVDHCERFGIELSDGRSTR